MDTDFDTGNILYQIQVKVEGNDTVASLYTRIMDKSVALIPRLISDAHSGRLTATPQEQFPWKPSYYSSTAEEKNE
jgi:methionyl-tRNA formyltransferase